MYTNVANHSSDDRGLSTGQIVGITLGSILSVIVLIIAIMLLVIYCFLDTMRKCCGFLNTIGKCCGWNSSNTNL